MDYCLMFRHVRDASGVVEAVFQLKKEGAKLPEVFRILQDEAYEPSMPSLEGRTYPVIIICSEERRQLFLELLSAEKEYNDARKRNDFAAILGGVLQRLTGANAALVSVKAIYITIEWK